MRKFIFALVIWAVVLILVILAQAVSHYFRKPPPTPRVTITIPEGLTVSDINKRLSDAGVLSGEMLPSDLEGYLFPDTYEFFIPSGVEVVKKKFLDNFKDKIEPVISGGLSGSDIEKILTIASLIEKEIPNFSDRKIVSGIIQKRLKNNMPLQIDASICYIKLGPCVPITSEDKKINSLYNTYRYKGLPPGPIDNPGLDAIEASVNPKPSPYWYYLSDPKTGKTIFSKTLDEHNVNVVKYLGD